VNILLVNSDKSLRKEFSEFFGEISARDFFANSTEEAIGVLNEHSIDVVILKISRLSDAAILKYINDYYQHIRVLVSARKDFEEALTIFNQTHFEKLNSPIGLADLRGHLTH
jgi:DNA-binding NtrC family response regulator